MIHFSIINDKSSWNSYIMLSSYFVIVLTLQTMSELHVILIHSPQEILLKNAF